MKVLSINAGSSSLKFRLFMMPEEFVLCSGVFERIGLDNSFLTIIIDNEKKCKDIAVKCHEDVVNILIQELINFRVINNINEIEAIGHRVVHGGDKYSNAVVIDDNVLNNVMEISYLAPLHNPVNIIGIRAFNKVLPNVKAVAVFDTAFHQTMEETAYIYPVPYEWYKEYGVRKYGFHGTSHKYIARQISEILNNQNLKIISCHLGNGGSLCAIKNGVSVDTTMGFTPLAGIAMGTRAGDIDPSIIPFIMSQTGMNIEQILDVLNKKSGLLGISGISSDMRDIEEGIEKQNKRCKLAYSIYIRKIVSFISSYNTLLGGADVICFTAGIGENSIGVRKDIIDMLQPLGIYLDEEKNNIRGEQTLISNNNSKIKCYIIPTNEELMIAKETYELMM